MNIYTIESIRRYPGITKAKTNINHYINHNINQNRNQYSSQYSDDITGERPTKKPLPVSMAAGPKIPEENRPED